jgi:hypothetical protein
MDLFLEFLREFSEGIFLVLGGLIGFASSVAMWRRQVHEERRRKKADYILRAVHLATSSLTYARSLLYSKIEGVTGALSLPENPVDELMALASIHLAEVAPVVQQLHDKQQMLFGDFSEEAEPAQAMLALLGEFPPLVNALIKQLRDLGEKNENTV